jgi:glycosyltransferase involved in cell wall biosynthesis
LRYGGYDQSNSIKRDLVRCLLYALRASPRLPAADIVVTNDFWTPAVLPRLRPSVGRIVANANRFPKGQFWLYGKVAAFAAASASVAGAIVNEQPRWRDRVEVVPNALDDAFLQAAPTKEARRASGKVRVLFAGRLHPEKGLSLLARSLGRLRHEGVAGWECVVVGPLAERDGGGGEAYGRELRSMTQSLPVRFEPPVFEPAALARMYAEADIFVYPSLAEQGESFGLAPLEAMAGGAAAVVSDLAVFRDYLDPDVNGMAFDHRAVDPAESLAGALRCLIEDPDRREQIARAGRGTAGKFSLATVADKYLGLFRRVMAEG